MGFGKLSSWLGLRKKEANVVVVGLDNSGKTTILNRMKPEQEQKHDIVPTIGFSVEQFNSKSIKFSAFDMSGQGRYRNLWEAYYKDCHGIIFVLDSSDKLRMSVAKDELSEILEQKDIQAKSIPILFFANKMDHRDALNSTQCVTMLGLDKLAGTKSWHICASNALTGEGLEEGFSWFTDALKEVLARKK